MAVAPDGRQQRLGGSSGRAAAAAGRQQQLGGDGSWAAAAAAARFSTSNCHQPLHPPQVWGGYDILLAHNTLVRVGCGTPAQELHRAAVDILFCERSCGGERAEL